MAYKELTERVNTLADVRCGVLMYWANGLASMGKFLTEHTTNFKSGKPSQNFIMGLIRKGSKWHTAYVAPWKDALEDNRDWPGLRGHNEEEEDEGHPSYLATDGSEQMIGFPQHWLTGIAASSLDMMMDDIKEQEQKALTSSRRPGAGRHG
jgi:hypothetical protein